MKVEVNNIVTLDNDADYLVTNKLDYENNTYFAMCNLNDDKDLKIVRQEGNELVEFFDFELLTKLVCLFDSQNKMNSEIN
ncbi:MAG: hypothetical protein MSH29_05370 [Tenericutes bacterium]|nr:hypothetical protein [Mycoplasmatota bacterium]